MWPYQSHLRHTSITLPRMTGTDNGMGTSCLHGMFLSTEYVPQQRVLHVRFGERWKGHSSNPPCPRTCSESSLQPPDQRVETQGESKAEKIRSISSPVHTPGLATVAPMFSDGDRRSWAYHTKVPSGGLEWRTLPSLTCLLRFDRYLITDSPLKN